MASILSSRDVEAIRDHVQQHRVSVAIVRTEHAPTELETLLKTLAEACEMRLSRKTWTPSSDFGFAELNSDEKILVVLWVGGPRTELVSVSEGDMAQIAHMENEIFMTNYLSSSIRDGL
ncbi:MAG: hypothetical protein QXJ32_01270 [Thermoplasmata archaeon]